MDSIDGKNADIIIGDMAISKIASLDDVCKGIDAGTLV